LTRRYRARFCYQQKSAIDITVTALPVYIEPKKLRAADFSWEAPPSPVKTSISSTAIIALQLRIKR
jgi:hypothetical protein